MAQTIEDLERKIKTKSGVIESLKDTIGKAKTEASDLKDMLKQAEEERELLVQQIKAIKAHWSDDRAEKEDLETITSFFNKKQRVEQSGILGKGDCGDQIEALLLPFHSDVQSGDFLAGGICYRGKSCLYNWAFTYSSARLGPQGTTLHARFECKGGDHTVFMARKSPCRSLSAEEFENRVNETAARVISGFTSLSGECCGEIRDQIAESLEQAKIYPTFMIVKREPGGFENWGYCLLGGEHHAHKWHKASDGVFTSTSFCVAACM